MSLLVNLLLISCGASLGAMSRYGLTLLLNPFFTFLSFGTLVANYIGCLIMGIVLAIFWHSSPFAAEWRLFFVTGFLGSLTTFSAFSAEIIENLIQHKWLEGITIASLHIIGCLLFTTLGVFIWRYFQ
ncbi:fluoride efflux transporter CrcB [Pasteurella canis]|uniref:fluoride efflux transporter CrcB n=1 Tax=Pasteurella canis TaxID=753 RepID=UPI00066511CE|nr:fluoride efflux transporter CrcB [Pasteurella canis]UAX41975.1 fluoride efflux transporter CrcB [Pasteurella canis]